MNGSSEEKTDKVYSIDMGGGKSMSMIFEDVSPTLACTHYGEPVVFDARGNGGGETCPTITGEHQNRVTDYTAIVVTRKCDSSNGNEPKQA